MITVPMQKNSGEVVTYDLPHLPIHYLTASLSFYFQMAAPCHWHSEWEFTVVLEGSMTYYVNGRHYLLQPGWGIFVNQNRMHYGYSTHGADCRFFCLVVSPSIAGADSHILGRYIDPLLSDADSAALVLEPGVSWEKEILWLLTDVYRHCEARDIGYELEITAACLRLILLLYQNTVAVRGVHPESNKDTAALTSMVSFIQKNYQHKITLDAIASSGLICKTKCSQLFKKHFSQTPMEYVTAFRLQKSMGLMADPSKSITEIALLCGFCSPSYYVETFKKCMKTTPSKFRKKTGKENL